MIHCFFPKNVLLIGIMMVLAQNSWSQSDSTSAADYYKKDLNLAEMDILYSYYQQDGDHSPVLGGTGTEYLTDHVGQINIVVPYKRNSFSLLLGIDHYTSASTDKIDPATVSSASVVDDRMYFNVGWDRIVKKMSYGFNTGFSSEWDVNSLTIGGNISISDRYKNNQLIFSAQYYKDRWSLVWPVELRNKPSYETGSDIRNIYDVSATWSTVINKRLQASFVAQLVHQNGILATPFHRIYFKDEISPAVESLPRERWKFPVSARFNYYINETFIVRSFYRFYKDDFDITAHTVNVEIPIKLGMEWTFIPNLRYHSQSESKYFAPINTHTTDEVFYTSDYDLSQFTSQNAGIAVRYSPIGGLFNLKSPIQSIPYINLRRIPGIQLKKIELRTSYYSRSDGLNAFIISIGAKFIIN